MMLTTDEACGSAMKMKMTRRGGRRRGRRRVTGGVELPDGFFEKVQNLLDSRASDMRELLSWLEVDVEGGLRNLWVDMILDREYGKKGTPDRDNLRVIVGYEDRSGNRSKYRFSWKFADTPEVASPVPEPGPWVPEEDAVAEPVIEPTEGCSMEAADDVVREEEATAADGDESCDRSCSDAMEEVLSGVATTEAGAGVEAYEDGVEALAEEESGSVSDLVVVEEGELPEFLAGASGWFGRTGEEEAQAGLIVQGGGTNARAGRISYGGRITIWVMVLLLGTALGAGAWMLWGREIARRMVRDLGRPGVSAMGSAGGKTVLSRNVGNRKCIGIRLIT